MVTCYTKKGFTATFYQLLGKTTTLHGHQNWTYLVSSTPDYLKRTFSGVSVKIWNEIPSRLKKLSKKNLSEKTIEEFLISDLGKKDFYLVAINIIEKLKLTNSFVS